MDGYSWDRKDTGAGTFSRTVRSTFSLHLCTTPSSKSFKRDGASGGHKSRNLQHLLPAKCTQDAETPRNTCNRPNRPMDDATAHGRLGRDIIWGLSEKSSGAMDF